MVTKKSILSEEFPKKLRQLRQSRQWSQGQFAKKVGADPNRVSKYERGVMWPTTELIVKMAMAFEVSVDYLIRDGKDVAINKISNQALLQRLEEIDQLSEDKQLLIIGVLDAVIKQQKFEKLVNS